jgi:hypothetical protein
VAIFALATSVRAPTTFFHYAVFIDHAGPSRLLQPQGHVRADQVGHPPDERRDVQGERVAEGRHEDARPGGAHQDHVLKVAKQPGVVGGGQQVCQLQSHLARSDLGAVDVAGDEHDDLSFADDPFRLPRVQQPRVGQLARHLAELDGSLKVPWGGDGGHHHVVAEGGPSKCQQGETIGGVVQDLEIFDDLVIVGQLAIAPEREAEEFVSRGRPGRPRRILRQGGAER